MTRVLVVEDDDLIRESLVDLLAHKGFGVTGAANGADALVALANGPPPSVILLDLMMPVMDGLAFRQAQLRDPAIKDIPVIILSANRELAEVARDLSPADYLLKPVRLGDLLKVVERVTA
ncbi:MAG TPA: response regulator [Kofleriaceae bacterium]|jgi:CheY-like chemotaxis protein